MKNKILLTLLFATLLLGACAQDPFLAEQIRAQAEAAAVASRSSQEALDHEQARQQSADLHAVQMQDEARQQARKDTVEPVVRFGWQVFLFSTFLVCTVAVVYSVVVIGRQTVVQVNRVQEAVATAIITTADIRSREIRLDPVTRQFPLLYQYDGHGRFLLTDPNTKVTMQLDTRNEGDAQLIAGAIAIRHSGLLAMEARKTGDKDGSTMAVISPPIVEATAFDVKSLAKDLVKKGGWDDE